MKFIKKIFSGFCTGTTIGMAFSLFFSKWYGISYVPSTPQFISHFNGLTNAVLMSVILWGLMGILWTLCGRIFKIKPWSLLKQTIVHFIVSYVGYTILAILCGWFPMNWLFYYTIIFILAYVFFWIVVTAYEKHNIRKINQVLNNH